MRRLFVLATCLAVPAFAQEFDAANSLLTEKSYSRACDAFTAYVKAHPAEREAQAKKAASCVLAGKGSNEELRKIADGAEKDFGKAIALQTLWTRGERGFDTFSGLLKQAMGEDGRRGKEARTLLEASLVRELDNAQWDSARTEKLVDFGLTLKSDAEHDANYRFHRARAWINTGAKLKDAEAELASIGAGKTDVADDALFLLGQRRENESKFVEALGHYDAVVKRFSSVSSNVRSSAESRASSIRQPSVSVYVQNNELPGQQPQISVSFRNVKNAKWKLKRLDPIAMEAKNWPSDPAVYEGETIKTWTSTLTAPGPFAPGSETFALSTSEPGAYAIEINADGQVSRAWALVTQIALITKTDRKQVIIAAFDVDTGKAQPDAEVALFLYRSGGTTEKKLGRTDATGLVTFAVEKTSDTMLAWVRKGAQLAWASAGNSYWNDGSREELGYLMTDRPLYKPGESVGLKLFLRSRQSGPSVPMTATVARVIVSDPQGKALFDQEVTTNEFGTASAMIPLPKTAALGAYWMSVSVKDHNIRAQSASFRVEEYKPPESFVTVQGVGAPQLGQKVTLKVKASYFSGGPIANASGRALITIQPWNHTFGAWADDTGEVGNDDEEYGRYRRGYRNDYYGVLAQHTVLFKTGSDGTAEIEVPAQLPSSDLRYVVQAFVTDSSRREVRGDGAFNVSKQKHFVDLRSSHFIYRPGERLNVQLRAEDANAKPVTADVVVRLMRLTDTAVGAKITEVRTRIVNGVGRAVLDGDAIGPVRIEVLEDEAVLAATDAYLTNDRKPVVNAPGFQLLVDRAPIGLRDSLRVLVAGGQPGGHVLLSLESEALSWIKMVELDGRAKFIELPVTEQLAPSGWLSAMRFEDLQLQQRRVQVRVHGNATDLPVKVDFGRASAEPGSTVTASITTASKLASLETSLTVVDESIFSIAPERTDFMGFFSRPPRPLLVVTHTSYDQRRHQRRVAPQKQDRPDTAKDKAGAGAPPPPKSAPAPSVMASEAAPEGLARRQRGSADDASEEKSKKEASGPAANKGGGDEAIAVRTDFSTSAGWYPALQGGSLSQNLKLKDSLTSWKAVATVVSTGPEMGQGSAQIKAAKSLMVRLQAPRFFVEGDEVTISAIVESHLPKTTEVDVTITAPGFRELQTGTRRVKVEPEQTLRVDARFKVVELGERTLRATVKGGGTSDGMEWKLPAFVHGSAQRQFFSARTGSDQRFEFELPEKRKASLTKFELTLSPTLLSVMFDGLPYLAQYPYGCVEQTLSRFVPAVIARRAAKDLNLPSDRLPKDLDDMTVKGLERLYGFQHGDGGWGWWQSDPTNLWMSAYVVSSLSLAKSAGLDVRAEVITRGRAFLESHLGEALNTPETHAYMVYALASTGGAPKAAVDTLFSRRTTLQPRSRALLALSLQHLKDPRSRIAVENLDDIVKAAQARPDAAVGEANDIWSTSAAIEATAFTLMAYVRHDPKSALIGPLTDFLVLRRNGGKWRNTRDTAFAIYALAELAKTEKAGARSGTFIISVNGKEVRRVPYTAGGLSLTAPVMLGDKDFVAGKNAVSVKHDGGGTGYFGATVDVFNMNDFIRGVGGDVTVKRTYTMLGKPSTDAKVTTGAEYGMPVESGVRVRVDLELTANKAVEFVMIEDLKPAGFESVELNSGPAVCGYKCAHAELRTDRVAMFLPQIPVGTTRLSYELRAEVPGRFSALPARTEAMYAPEITATSDEMRFEVRDEAPGQVAR